MIESLGEPTSHLGLSEREAERRLAQHGPNAIERCERPSHLRDLAAQFTHPLAIASGTVIVLNAVFAFRQELEAERATEALREFLTDNQARYARLGRWLITSADAPSIAAAAACSASRRS